MLTELHANPRCTYWNCQELSAVSWRILEVNGGGSVAGYSELPPQTLPNLTIAQISSERTLCGPSYAEAYF